MRGSLPLKSGIKGQYRVFGGPYLNRPHGTVGVKMAAEIREHCDINVPTLDYSVPFEADALAGLEGAIDCILKGQPLYVGCMGGIGRTGLMLALIAKAWGIKDPVAYVREHYYPHAVETRNQQVFIDTFEIPPRLRWKIRMRKLKDLVLLRDAHLTTGAEELMKKIVVKTKTS